MTQQLVSIPFHAMTTALAFAALPGAKYLAGAIALAVAGLAVELTHPTGSQR